MVHPRIWGVKSTPRPDENNEMVVIDTITDPHLNRAI